jgi:acylaminoacyl-peptidase
MRRQDRRSGEGLFPALALAAVLAAPALAPAAPRPFTAQDLVMLDRVSDPHLSPDGRLVAYDLRTTDWDADRGVHAVWVAGAGPGGPAPRRLKASDGGATGPQWSPDGRAIYFLSGRSGSDQVWRTDLEGERAVQVTRLPLDVGSFRVSPDGRTLVVSLAVFPDCPDLQCSKARLDRRAEGKPSGQVHDRLFVRHWDAWADGTRNHLFAVRLDQPGAAPVDLMRGLDADTPSRPFGDNGDYAIAPDGRAVIFSAKIAGRTEAWSTNFDLWRAPMDAGAPPQNLTAANPGADAGPAVSPDGTRLAWRQQKRAGFESDRNAVMVMDLRTGAVREADPAFDRSADQIAWSADGRTLFLTAEDLGQTRLFALDPATGRVRALTGVGRVAGFDVGRDSIVFAHDALDSPAQLFRVAAAGGPAAPLTRHNAERLKELTFGAYEQFAFPGWNGETVHGYVVKPADFQPGRRYPVAFLIHGGPQGSFGNLFHYRWNAETYAGAGYAVVMIDFHGSTGYGQAFTDSISGHWGDRPLEDLQKGWAYALARYDFLDGGRACALGGSYGGYMVNWIAGHWNGPWRCLVDHDGVFDNRMMGYSTEELWFSEWENGGTPWQADYERFNPVDAVAQWSKPELVIHGGRDYRIPLEQGLGAFTALQRKGVPSRFLYFPDENHWVVKPHNSLQWHRTVEDWLDRWTAPEAH